MLRGRERVVHWSGLCSETEGEQRDRGREKCQCRRWGGAATEGGATTKAGRGGSGGLLWEAKVRERGFMRRGRVKRERRRRRTACVWEKKKWISWG